MLASKTSRFKRQLFVALLSLLVVGVGSAQSATYYVSVTGNDSNDGSQGSPWRSIQRAANTANDGDVVLVGDGNYAGFASVNGGTAANPVTFRADGSNVVINQPASNGTENINIEGTDYVIIDGFKVEDAPRFGIRIAEATGVIVQNNTVARSGRSGIFSGFTPSLQILNNTAHSSIDQHGIYVSNSRVPDDALIVRGNESFGNNFTGLQVNGDCTSGGDGVITNAIIENNYIHDNFGKGFSILSTQNSIIVNNIIVDNGVVNGAGGIHLADIPGCGKPSLDNVIANNTIIEPRIACIRATDLATSNYIFNNVIIATGGNGTFVDEVGGNQIDGPSNIQQTTVADIFLDAFNRNFRLNPAGPAVDRGTASFAGQLAPSSDYEGNPRPLGNAHDAGAYESTGAINDTGPPTVAITAPSDGATVSGGLTVEADASDDTGVTQVRFLLDGSDFTAADTQAPYSVTIASSSWSNGPHTLTCIASDIAGNSTTSAPVAITVDNVAPPPSNGEHPRLFLTPERLSRLQALASQNSPEWLTLLDTVQKGNGSAWFYALMYQITGDVNYANTAISRAAAKVAGGVEAVHASEKNFLHVNDFLRDVALIYDWCYDLLSVSERNAWRDYMYKVMYIVWNPGPNGPAHVATPTNIFGFNWSGWATQDPASNIYANFLLSHAYMVIATEGEGAFPYTLPYPNTGPTYTDPEEFLNVKLNQQFYPWLDSFGVGGGWIEGENYGERTKMWYGEMFLALRDAGKTDHFFFTEWPRQAALYQLFIMQPGWRVIYPGGDNARDPQINISTYTKHVVWMLADGLKGTVESQYLQYWLNNFAPSHTWTSHHAWQFMLKDPGLPSRDFRELPNGYVSQGTGVGCSRSSWDNDAVAVTFQSAERVKGHMHADQNTFAIFRGASSGSGVDGWQVVETEPFDGMDRHTRYHNTILVDGWAQRYGGGTGEIIKFERTDEFTYMVGDASDAYWTNGFDFNHGDDKLTDVYIREVVHMLPDQVIIYDRISPTAQFPSAVITNLFQYPSSAPSKSGDTYTHSHGSGKVFHNILLPTNYNASVVNDINYRVELESAQIQPNYQFLNTFYVTGSGVTSQPAVSRVFSQDNNMVGVKIEEAAEDHVVLFSAEPSGAVPVNGVLYEVGFVGPTTHNLFGMIPDADFRVDVVVEDGIQQIIVAPGIGYRSSEAGSLTFKVDGQGLIKEERFARQ